MENFRSIYTYEVTLRLVNKNTKETKLITRTEHAYSVMDAVMQASINQTTSFQPGSTEVFLEHVGPPAEMIRLAATQLDQDIAMHINKLTKIVTDAVGLDNASKATVSKKI